MQILVWPLLLSPLQPRSSSLRIHPTTLSLATDLEVRDLADSDLVSVGQLLRSSFAPASNPVSGVAIVAEHVLALRKRRATNHELVATTAGGDVVGFVECFTPAFLASEAGSDYPDRVRSKLKPYVASLCVAPAARRKGVGMALMRAVESRVQRGPPPHVLSLEVEEGDVPAVELYSRALGYALVGRDDDGRRLVGDVFFGR